MRNNSKVLFLVEIAIFSALAYLLDELSGFLTGRFWPQGGSVSIGMLPIFIMAYRWGIKGGLLTGFLFGGLQLILGQPWIATPVQAFLEYFVAFTVVGLAGVFAKQIQQGLLNGNAKKWVSYIILGTLIGGLLRFICHFVAGIVFFAEYAPEGTPVVLYSLGYNGGYMSISTGICIVLLFLLMPALPKKYVASK
ncbi:thiamine transporter [Salirhabdus euzebyi]|uniref:Thiamine transporter n=1 Tax=Salirhabdus euzebyi TaxID=394506 RepID=A0A841Q6U0_9BACI|nr:energy-coupled thiamine transporter ThiT [Salirhabdus euzebyi]MBB6454121.1 thiamine transporter [Salirhabdus euzebyi]